MHKNGPYFVEYGSIYSRYNNGVMLDENITILVDIEVGTLLKVGTNEIVTNYYNVILEKYTRLDCLDLTIGLRLITFNVCYEDLGFKLKNYNLNIDEVCTILNWFSNSIGSEKMNWFLSLDIQSAKSHIKSLQTIGF